MVRLIKDARTEPRVWPLNTLRRLGSWKVTAALLLAMVLVQIWWAFGWAYWTLLGLYVVQMVTGYWVGNWWSRSADAQVERGPSWRRIDSRTTDGDERGKQ